ncbi:MAG: CHAT domain-containing protein [Bryobacterales bacterium]|nr:CHAT domain-containing protein [Bryobacterales bacterium]
MLRRLGWCTTLLIAALAAVSCALPQWQLQRASGLVNAAYQRYRPFEYRWPGAPWAELKSRFVEPSDLRAELLAIQKLQPADDPRVRILRARVLLLAGKIDAAITQYKLALYSSEQAATRAELAVAIALRGGVEQRAVDYAQALDQIAMALHAGDRSAEAQHNFAALLERFPMPLQAAEQWKKASQGAGKWGEEAISRAKNIEHRMQRREAAIGKARDVAVTDAAGASERALDHVVGEVFAAPWTPLTRENLARLAASIDQRHGDRWLLDLLAQPHPSEALRSLSNARLANLSAKYQEADSIAVRALRSIAPQQTALSAALEAERVYALQRRGLPCAQEASALHVRAASRSYLLLAIHAELDAIAGRTRLGAIDTFPAREAAYERASRSGYESAALRALGFLVERHVSLGRPLFHWSRAREGLDRYWAGVVPELRGHQFYYSLAQLAEGWNRPYVAALLAAESERVLRPTLNQATYAMTLSKARLLAARTGSAYESPRDLESILSASDFPEQAKPVVRVEMAETATLRGQPDRALEVLSAGGPMEFGHFSRLFQAQARGDALLAKGRLEEAESCYREVISENDKRLVNIANGVQRDASCRQVEASYRGLADIQLRQGRAADALATWRVFRSAGREGRAAGLDPGAVALTIAALPSGVWIWLETASSLRAAQLPVRTESYQRTAEMFAAVASDPEAPEPAVRETGEQLARPLRPELEPLLSDARTLIIDADGPFARVPWPAMPLRSSGYWIDRAAVIQTAGGASPPSLGASAAEGLIVAEPTLPASLRKEFPRLPDAKVEALRIHRKAPRATLIEASSATGAAMRRLLPSAGFLHFAGHGISHGGFGALLVAPEPDGSRPLLTAQELADLNLSRLKLVFLAACSAADGEPSGNLNADHLVRAFLESGASRVIAARWAARSSVAADIGGMFYDQWLGGSRAEDALRDAILRVRGGAATSHPYYWAGFQIFSRH